MHRKTLKVIVASLCMLSLWCAMGRGALADDDYKSITEQFQKNMSEVKDDAGKRKAVYIEHAKRLNAYSKKDKGEMADRALIDSAVYFDFGGDSASSDAAFSEARKRATTWNSKMILAQAARAVPSKRDLSNEVAKELGADAGDDPRKIHEAVELLGAFELDKEATKIAERAAKNEKLSPGDRAEFRNLLKALQLKPGGEPIEFSARTRKGDKPISLKDFKGKVVLLDFWATWCGPCLGELPNVQEIYKANHGKGFEIIGVSLDNDVKQLDNFVAQREIPWAQICDGKGWQADLAKLYNVHSIPATYLMGRDGKIIGVGLRGPDLTAAVEKAVTAK